MENECENKDIAEVAICRVCLSECIEYNNIYKKGILLGEVTSLSNLLNFCIGMEFTEKDKMPEQICQRCMNSLARSYAFKKTVLESTELLQKQQHDILCDEIDVEDGGGGEIEDVGSPKQPYVADEVDAMELKGLAHAAHLKRSLDNMEYITLQVLDDDNAEELIQTEGDEVLVINEKIDDDSQDEIFDGENEEERYFYDNSVKNEDDENSGTDNYEVIMQEVEVDDDGQVSIVKRPYKRRQEHSVEGSDSEPKPKKQLRQRKLNRPKVDNPDWQCKICNKQLSNQNSFKYHMQLHSDKTPYSCKMCGEGFKTRNAYEGHIIIHDPNNPNTCELCGKSYRQPSSLRSHMFSHTGERPFQCDICGKGMTQKSGYKKHMLTHTGEKPHVCDICNREFRYSSNLIAHKRCHTGEKPFECSQCSKTFPSIEQLKRHMLVHTGERAFRCDLCDKSFKRRSAMAAHRQSHETLPTVLDQKLSKSNVVELY